MEMERQEWERRGYNPVNVTVTFSFCFLHFFLQDVHSRYRTEAHQDVVGRFNER